MLAIECDACGRHFSLASDDAALIEAEGSCHFCLGRPSPINPKPGHKIITYKDQRYSMIRLAHGEYVFLSVAQTGIHLYRGLFGLFPWGLIAKWPLSDVRNFVALFGGEEDGSPFLFAVKKIASFWTIAELREYVRGADSDDSSE